MKLVLTRLELLLNLRSNNHSGSYRSRPEVKFNTRRFRLKNMDKATSQQSKGMRAATTNANRSNYGTIGAITNSCAIWTGWITSNSFTAQQTATSSTANHRTKNRIVGWEEGVCDWQWKYWGNRGLTIHLNLHRSTNTDTFASLDEERSVFACLCHPLSRQHQSECWNWLSIGVPGPKIYENFPRKRSWLMDCHCTAESTHRFWPSGQTTQPVIMIKVPAAVAAQPENIAGTASPAVSAL